MVLYTEIATSCMHEKHKKVCDVILRT